MKKIPVSCGLALLALQFSGNPGRAEEYHDNVVIVLDASGSMKEALSGTGVSKMTAAKTAIKTVLQKVPPSTHVGLLVFSALNVKEDWVYPLGPRNDELLVRALDGLEAHGGTPLGHYIKKGADRLLEERARQFGYGTYRLLVVTDGEAQDQNLVEAYTPDVMSRGITLDVIGVGMKQDHTLARKTHSYRRANDPASLNRAITEVFAEIGSAATDTTQAEAFELLAPLPGEVAAAMIQALSSSGNHPIGTKPAPAAAPKPQPDSPATVPPVQAQPRSTQPAATPANPATPAGPPGHRKHFPWAVFIVTVILLSLLGKMRKGTGR